MIRKLATRLPSIATVLVVMLVGVGAALSGTLPAGLQNTVSEVADSAGFAVPRAPERYEPVPLTTPTTSPATRTGDRAQIVRDEIDGYTNELDAWTDCVAAAARDRRSFRPDPEILGSERRFDPTAACGEKPKLDVPHPSDNRSDRARDPGKPENPGKPDEAGSKAGSTSKKP